MSKSQEARYQKGLIAKYSPENKCNAEDGEVLVVARHPKATSLRRETTGHFFVGVGSGKRSRFAWVAMLQSPITPSELAALSGHANEADAEEDARVALEAANRLPEGTPCDCTLTRVVSADARRFVRVRIQKVIFFSPTR